MIDHVFGKRAGDDVEVVTALVGPSLARARLISLDEGEGPDRRFVAVSADRKTRFEGWVTDLHCANADELTSAAEAAWSERVFYVMSERPNL